MISLKAHVKDYLLSISIEKNRAIRITFTGGLGAQILSAAIYHHFLERGYQAVADLSYFENAHRIATPGQTGQISYWKWELDCYGIGRESLVASASGSSMRTLHDGAMKFELALKALNSPAVQARFNTPANDVYSAPYRAAELQGERYLCLHVRRGDFLNVASHLVSSSALNDIASRFAGLVPRILILSDSPIGPTEFEGVRKRFKDRVHIIDSNPDPVLAHSLMRNAAVLVCSNSQFSLSAGLLSSGLKIIPKIWFGADSERLNQAIDKISDFAVVR